MRGAPLNLRQSNLEKHQTSCRHQSRSPSLHDRIGLLLKNVVSSTSYITSKNDVRSDILQTVNIEGIPESTHQPESIYCEGNVLYTRLRGRCSNFNLRIFILKAGLESLKEKQGSEKRKLL